MNNNFQKIISIIIISISFFACSKHTHSTTTDATKPIITVAEPTANDTLSLALEPEVHVEFTTTDESGLHELNVLVIKNSTDTLLNDNPTVHDLTTYAYHEHVIPTGIISVTPMKVVITVNDHGNNIESRIINFFIEP
jgi:hypothetical protein